MNIYKFPENTKPYKSRFHYLDQSVTSDRYIIMSKIHGNKENIIYFYNKKHMNKIIKAKYTINYESI